MPKFGTKQAFIFFKSLLLGLMLIQILGSQPVSAGSPRQIIRENGILAITPGYMGGAREVCVGSSFRLVFLVNNASPGLEVPIPVAEAMVTVSDDQGNVRAQVTNAAGVSVINWPMKSTGTTLLTIKADKDTYQSAQPIRIQLKAINCKYGLSIFFHEEYAIIQDTLVVGATTSWKGTLQSNTGQGEDPVSELSLLGGSGNYNFYVADYFKAPIHFFIDPPVSGEYSIQVKGTDDGNNVQLEIQTQPVGYPQLVTMSVVDYGPFNLTVNYKPPTPTSDGNGLFLELNKLNNLTFPASGGVVSISSGMSCYFYTPDRTKYSLVVMLYPLKDLN